MAIGKLASNVALEASCLLCTLCNPMNFRVIINLHNATDERKPEEARRRKAGESVNRWVGE